MFQFSACEILSARKRSQFLPKFCKFPHDYAVPHPRKHYSLSSPKTTYDAEDVFELLNSHDRESKLDNLVEIHKQSDREEAEKPESNPKEKTKIVLIFIEENRLIEADIITLFADIDSNEQRTAKTIHGIVSILPCLVCGAYEEIRCSCLPRL